MAIAKLDIGGRVYEVACRDGEERKLARLAAMIQEKVAAAESAVGPTDAERRLLFASLLIADDMADLHAQLDEARSVVGEAEQRLRAAESAMISPAAVRTIENLAARAEALVTRLEKEASTS